ncbi:MAG: GNAT family N-acetyltransferase [Flavobacteriaceae bacterium]
MEDIRIQIATQADAQFIALLGRITFTETFEHLFRDKQDLLDYCNTTFSVDKIEKSLSKAENVFWIALAEKLPVGYAKLKLNSPSEFNPLPNVSQLQKIYVLKDFLSRKVGFQLQEEVLKKAKEKGSSAIWLSVLNENSRAIGFYKRNEFAAIGQHDFQIGKEHFEFTVMSKSLHT